ERAVGIDVHEPFISVANDVRDHLNRRNARFHLATLREIAEEPSAFGGPFQFVQLISTYHYLFWGSDLDSGALMDHSAILTLLARVCARYLLFASPLEIRECPRIIQDKARTHGDSNYNRAAFMRATDQWFDVFDIGHMDRQRKRQMLLMVKR